MANPILTATIEYPHDPRIIRLFASEEKSFPRASYNITEHDSHLRFNINAHDATALRACMTTITKVLSVWETTSNDGHETDE